MRSSFLAFIIAAGAFAQTRTVEVERQRVLFLSREYLRHSQYLEGKDQDVIAAWGWRVLQFPLDSGKYKEVVAEDPNYRFSNGAVAWDLDGDGNEELIVGRYLRERHKEHEILWYERAADQDKWVRHYVGIAPASNGEEMPHDMVKFVDARSGLQALILAIGRRDLYLFEKPDDPRKPWKRYDIGKLPDPPQSGMRLADLNGDGRLDIVTGMHWLECPADARTGEWKARRYGDWDRQKKPWGGMNLHGIADFDGDGQLEMVVDEAENDDSRVAIFKRDPKNPNGLWKWNLIDTGLYCPHSMEVADLNDDGRPDFLIGEMDAGGWQFPYTPKPRLIAYLNRGDLKFQKTVLAEGLGTHEGKFAPKRFRGRTMFYANSTTQPWFDGMITNLTTWTIQPVGTAPTQVAFQDSFAGKLGEGWQWVREQPGAWKAGEKGLILRTLSGTLWGKTNNARNLLLRPAPVKGDFSTEVDVSIQSAMDGEQAGLIWYGGDGDYIKLVSEFKGQPFLILVREERDSGKEIGRIPAPDGAVTLRLVLHRGWVRAQARPASAAKWQDVAECAGLPQREFRVGVFTHVWPGQTDRSVRFQGFRLLREQ